MIIKTVQTLVFEYPEDYQAEVEWNKKRDGNWVHQSTDTICSVYTLTNNYLIPTKAKHSFVDNTYFEAEQTEPQTDAKITELAKEIVHKMIDNSDIAEDAYPDLRQRMHEAVERLDEYYTSEDERSK